MDAAENKVLAVWVGGSFSPPTKAHVAFIVEIGRKAQEMNKGNPNPAQICVVPVSHAYNKPSINKTFLDTGRTADRERMMGAFITAIQTRGLEAGIPSKEVQFRLMDYEMKSPADVKTAVSLQTLRRILKEENTDKDVVLYFSVGQDLFESMSGWSNPAALKEFPLMIIPRGNANVLKTKYNAWQVGKPAGRAENIIVDIAAENAEASSTRIRDHFQKEEDEAAYALMDPIVADELRSISDRNGNPYKIKIVSTGGTRKYKKKAKKAKKAKETKETRKRK